MKSLVVLLILATPYVTYASSRSVGALAVRQEINVPRDISVELHSVPRLYATGVRHETILKICRIGFGEKVVVVEFTADKKSALVSYKTSSSHAGLFCENGARFYLPVSELIDFEKAYKAAIAEIDKTSEEIETILKTGSSVKTVNGLYVGQELPVPKGHQVVAHSRYRSKYLGEIVHRRRDDTCSIYEGGVVKILGFLSDNKTALLSYPTPVGSIRTECSPDVIFLYSLEEVAKFPEAYQEILSQRATLKANIQSILDGKSQIHSVENLNVGQVVRTGRPKYPMPRIAVEGMRTFRSNATQYYFDDLCELEKGSTVKILGFLPDRTRALVMFTPSESESESEAEAWHPVACPDKTELLIPINQLQ